MSSDPPRIRHDAALASVLLALGLLLVIVGQTLLGQWQMDVAHGQRSTFEHLLALASSAAGIAIVSWWILSLGLASWAAVLHGTGRSGSANAIAKFSPAFMLRLACAVLSLNFLGVQAAQAAAMPEPQWQATSSGGTSMAAWHPSAGTQGPVPPVEVPARNTEESHEAKPGPAWQPRPPIVEPGLLSRPGSRGMTFGHPAEAGIVVKPGDTLWSIAAASLGPLATDVDIALHWPSWYSANRRIIGDDPSTLRAGQVLQPPTPS
ncbi:LysM domain-containing protein [Arthrobacter sp. StoSoilA2]|uniref:LysM peptidoglycan-binding domain-containing protein n=2 Tax=unclassified Arthrobacter TaxID=235627 RepID=UPI001CC5158F|nr:LysM domain-containing protein [Arthrobacter sp. StoSoilA2]